MKLDIKEADKIRVGIGFVTGRKNFKKVIKTYVENWGEYGHRKNKKIELHVIIAYDLNYTNAEKEDFIEVEDEINEFIDSVNFISDSDGKDLIRILNKSGLITNEEGNLVFGEGYGRKRNLISYWAIQNNIDYLLFIDDDEYPIAPAKILSDKLTWLGQNVLGTHLEHIKNANITAGYHCGYISPIPYIEFNEKVSENDFKVFIEAISNDIVNWESIKSKLEEGKGATFADMNVLLNSQSKEIDEEFGGKWIAGSNVCLNLTKPESLPPYYNPPGARGEDTFLSTCLSNLKVKRVPCYTFHDGFLKYQQILSGVLPHKLNAIFPQEEMIKRRFIKACIGWVRYKPLLVYITRRSAYSMEVSEIKIKLQKTVPILNSLFQTNEFNQVIKNFELFDKNVKNHYDEFKRVQDYWYKIILHRDRVNQYDSRINNIQLQTFKKNIDRNHIQTSNVI